MWWGSHHNVLSFAFHVRLVCASASASRLRLALDEVGSLHHLLVHVRCCGTTTTTSSRSHLMFDEGVSATTSSCSRLVLDPFGDGWRKLLKHSRHELLEALGGYRLGIQC